ncbi:MAG: phenylalanine--tRNA ligase subunit alpha, partial [Clostridia bacterium]|nr:phenylalanine--tRNA ligase subunit alpha [Clostridia bacterium]
AGMVHPKVLEMSGVDSTIYKGFAAGIGLDRLVMMKSGVSDLRDLYENDINLLKQFK